MIACRVPVPWAWPDRFSSKSAADSSGAKDDSAAARVHPLEPLVRVLQLEDRLLIVPLSRRRRDRGQVGERVRRRAVGVAGAVVGVGVAIATPPPPEYYSVQGAVALSLPSS